MPEFKGMVAEARHERNTYQIRIAGEDPDTDIQMVDARGDGEFFLVMDGKHPIALIFNEGDMDFKGITGS